MNSDIRPLQMDPSYHFNTLESRVREHIDHLLHSPHFDASARSREFLCFIVDEALSGRGDNLTQLTIAKSVFRRKDDFDAILDPIVRVQMGRLRRSLERYYLLNGNSDFIRIDIPKGRYSPVFSSAPAKAEITSELEITSLALTEVAPDWPTIVIQSFDRHVSKDGDEVAERLQNQLTLELHRYGGVNIARSSDVSRLTSVRQSAVRFELVGAMRKMTGSYLIGARLIDRETGQQVWADEYLANAKSGDSQHTINDIASAIAARIGAEHGVVMRLLARERCSRVEMTGAFSALLRCNHFFLSRQGSNLLPALEEMEQLVIFEPEVSVAWTYLARLYLTNYAFELSDAHTSIDKAIGHAYQGVALDPTNIRGRCVLAKALLIKGELASARTELEHALRLNPDSLAYRELIGWLMALAGDWDRGIGLMRNAVERNPFCLPYVQHGLWADHLLRGEFDKAYVAALEYCGSMFFWRELMIASCLGHLGRLSDADASVMELLHAKPDFPQRGRMLIGYFIKSNELRDRIIDGLAKAGLILV
jgi:adenylate cyclase